MLEQTRRRGRWAKITSVQVYTKEHLWLRNRSRFSDEDLQKEARLITNADKIGEIWIRIYEDLKRSDPESSRVLAGRPMTIEEMRELQLEI